METFPCKNPETEKFLGGMIINREGEGYAGMMKFHPGELFFDEKDKFNPFFVKIDVPGKLDTKLAEKVTPTPKNGEEKRKKKSVKAVYKAKIRTEQEILDSLFSEDVPDTQGLPPDKVEIIQKVRRRNAKAVKNLKELYKGKCQITGGDLTFKKKDGALYSEAHHLIPLGNDGADFYLT